MIEPYYESDGQVIYCVRAEELLQSLEQSSIDLILVDPPYFKVKSEWWDRQWDKPAQFLEWIGTLCDQWKRVLKPNGSLYCFASPQMAWGVEGEIRKRFNVLTNIRWRKPEYSTKAEMFVKEDLRAPFPASETVIFAEQFAAMDGITNADYELNGNVYKPLKDWFRSRINGTSPKEFNAALGFATTGSGMAGVVIGNKAEFQMPTREVYQNMRSKFPAFNRTYEDLRREYEDLRREYEDLRRPFFASDKRPYTDVWDFPTVSDYPGKHPCEKPLAMMEHIIETSSRPDAVVLDCFSGSGVTGKACRNFGRKAILCDVEERWCEIAANRLRQKVLAFPLDSEDNGS